MTEKSYLGTPNELWAEMFSKFATIARMRPWPWFLERHSFAIHPEGYSEPFFVHPCRGRYACEKGLAIIYGWNADALFRRLIAGGDRNHGETRSLEMPVVLCALRKWEDLSQLEQLTATTFAGAKEGDKEVPAFVSFRPGWMPWHLGHVEVESTAKVLNQTLGVLLRAEEDISLIEQAAPGRTWVRRWDEKDSKWEEGWTGTPAFVEFGEGRPLSVSDKELAALNALPQTMPPISIDFDIVPKLALLNKEAVTLRGEDGRLPLGYLFAIQAFGPVAGAKPPPPETGVFYTASDIGSLFRFIPSVLAKFLLKAKARPAEIIVSSERAREILRPLQLKLPFKLIYHEKIPEYAKILAMVKGAVGVQVKKEADMHGEGADGDLLTGDVERIDEGEAGGDAEGNGRDNGREADNGGASDN